MQTKGSFDSIAKEIWTVFGALLGTRPYLAIIDAAGNIRHIDSPLEKFTDFVKAFVTNNFNLLNVGDHSLPLGGINLAFFKISGKAMLALYTVKGRSGQLLSFKARMFDWSPQIDELIGEIEVIPPAIEVTGSPTEVESEPDLLSSPEPSQERKRGLKTIPILIRKLKGNEKFPLEVAQVLQYCDGDHSIDEICEQTSYPRLKVDNIIRLYQKKKWLEVKRVL